MTPLKLDHHPGNEAAAASLLVRARYVNLVFAICCAAFAQDAAALGASARHHLKNASFVESTYLVGLQQGSYLSRAARNLRSGGFELSGGGSVLFNDWYKTRWTDVTITWMTQVNENFGVLFGASTGERGKKYTIGPSLKLGVVMQTQAGKNALLSLRATAMLGGDLREKSCTADYGEIGGVVAVNCRLAASTLPPDETLKHLLKEKPHNQSEISIALTWRF
jgi:hypothetical protein